MARTSPKYENTPPRMQVPIARKKARKRPPGNGKKTAEKKYL